MRDDSFVQMYACALVKLFVWVTHFRIGTNCTGGWHTMVGNVGCSRLAAEA
jgi:hypothetical protein